MDSQEFELQKQRVAEYQERKKEFERLERELEWISNGILSVTAEGRIGIDVSSHNIGFQDRIKNLLMKFYREEIKRVEKRMNDI